MKPRLPPGAPDVVELAGLLFMARAVGDEWPAVREELREAFLLSRAAMQSGEPIVYAVHNDDLLGRRGVGSAMVACGLLSAARTAALEASKAGISVNVLAMEESTPWETVIDWAELLMARSIPTGELIHLGTGHVGKALP